VNVYSVQRKMCTGVHIEMYTCVYREIHMCTCLSVPIRDTCMYVRTYVRTQVRTHARMYVCMFMRQLDVRYKYACMFLRTCVCICINGHCKIDEADGHDNKVEPFSRLLQVHMYARRTFVTTYVRDNLRSCVYVYECIPQNRRGRWPRQKSQANLMSAGGTPLGRPRTPLLCDVTHSYVRHDSLISVTCLVDGDI